MDGILTFPFADSSMQTMHQKPNVGAEPSAAETSRAMTQTFLSSLVSVASSAGSKTYLAMECWPGLVRHFCKDKRQVAVPGKLAGLPLRVVSDVGFVVRDLAMMCEQDKTSAIQWMRMNVDGKYRSLEHRTVVRDACVVPRPLLVLIVRMH